MRYFLSFLTFLFSLCAVAETPQDIVIKTRFDLGSSEAFISQLRTFLSHNNFGDPYSREFEKPIVIDLAKALEEIPADTRNWIRELQSVLKVKVFESDYRIVIDKFSYGIKDFNSEFIPGFSVNERVEYVTVNYVQGVVLAADRISFEIELKQTQTREPIKFSVELLDPMFIVSPEVRAELPMGWATSVLPNHILLSLDSIDISKVMRKVIERPDLISFKVQDVKIPDLSIRIGHKEIRFDHEKIKRFFLSRKQELKKGVLDLIGTRMGHRFTNILKDNPQSIKLPRTYALKSDINGVFDLTNIEVNRTGIVQFNIDSHFCENENLMSENFCREGKIPSTNRRHVSMANYFKSIRDMNRSLIERKTNIAVSVSEDYINQLIETTIKGGLWEDAFKGKEFRLGPEKSFMLADEKGELFSLYLDIIYKLKGAQRLLVGKSELRFPIRLMIALNIEDERGTPHFTIKVKKIGTDEKMLLEGLPQYGLPTNVNTVRFKKKVLQAIMADISTMENQTLIDIPMEQLRGTNLEELEFFSDGLGRATATIGFKKQETI